MADPASAPASIPRELARILRRHPRQLPERLMVFAVARLGEPTRAWAQRMRADASEEELAARCRAELHETITASRVDGAVAGTPFFVALVPAYVTFLWTQARMVLRIAALQGRDTADPAIAAELLALRGVYRSSEEAADALAHLDDQPPTPRGWRERVVIWFQLVRRILVLAAFVGPDSPEGDRPSRSRQIVFGAFGLLIWASTWVFPVTFMVVMAWGCHGSTRQLGEIAFDYYEVGVRDAAPEPQPGRLTRARAQLGRVRDPRALAWSISIGLSIAAPIVLIALAVSNKDPFGGWVKFVAPLAGLALVLALAARTRTAS